MSTVRGGRHSLFQGCGDAANLELKHEHDRRVCDKDAQPFNLKAVALHLASLFASGLPSWYGSDSVIVWKLSCQMPAPFSFMIWDWSRHCLRAVMSKAGSLQLHLHMGLIKFESCHAKCRLMFPLLTGALTVNFWLTPFVSTLAVSTNYFMNMCLP